MSDSRVTYRACHLCEALCGLEIRTEGDKIVSIKGDKDDPFSRGHICPKAIALQDIHTDPDRLRHPVQRVGNDWKPLAWDDAFTLVAERFADVQRRHGPNSLGIYFGNPNAHHVGSIVNMPAMVRALRTRTRFSATSVDQLPLHVACREMYGHMFLIPIPDVDHTGYWLILGGNPIVSNGSLMTVPDVAKRLKAIKDRGGKVVVIDPVRTETADVATRHHFIRPGTDAAFLVALVNALVELGPPKVERYGDRLAGLDEALAALGPFGVDAATACTGISAAEVRTIARELRDAASAVAYGRMGVSTQPFGSVCMWLIQLVNILTGNLDAVGGAMCTQPLVPLTGPGTRPGSLGKYRTRVSGRPIFGSEFPAITMSEEIETPGEGQVRAFLTVAGNPVSSTPNGRRLDRALASLEFMASIDIYVNETTRHADVILPPASMLCHDNYDVVFNALAVRNVARVNPPVFDKPEGSLYDWEIFNGLGRAYAKAAGVEYKEMPSPMTTLAKVAKAVGGAPHGVDLGPLKPSLLQRLETPDGRIQCSPAVMLADLPRVRAELIEKRQAPMRLVGRRSVRSNNSWMNNSHRLVKGPRRDQVWMNPADALALGVVEGAAVEVRSTSGAVQPTVHVTDRVGPGVVCLPHGFSQGRAGVRLAEASKIPGVSYNDLSEETADDVPSGNAALNALPVSIVPVPG
jgi:anaerobic selenocysteine-containing dehydrogenase